MIFNIEQSLAQINNEIILKIEFFWPKIIWALLIMLVWWILSRLVYLLSIYLFKKFKLNQFIDKLKIEFDWDNLKEAKKDKNKKNKIKKTRFTDKIKVDDVISKSIGYYIVIVFFRISISYIWITEIEIFLSDLIRYLPSLFVWILIWFFGIRFANFIYDVVYHTLSISKEKTSKIMATWAKIIILFFTLMLVLDYTKIVSEFIINIILIWFIWMLVIAWWLAFWLWWKDIAREIIESFRK